MMPLSLGKILRSVSTKAVLPEKIVRATSEAGIEESPETSSKSMRLRTLLLASELQRDQDMLCLTCTLSFTTAGQLLEHYEETKHGVVIEHVKVVEKPDASGE